jgi:predicted transcriptional regulator
VGNLIDDATDILISIKEEYVARILTGEKTVELRRRSVNVAPGSRVWVYTKKPHAQITLCAIVKKVIVAKPSELWEDHGQRAGITRAEFDNYFKGSSTACGIVLCNVRKIAPAPSLDELRSKTTSFHPPQFFKRMFPGDVTLDFLRSCVASTAITA